MTVRVASVIVGDRVGLSVEDNNTDCILVGSTEACDVGVSDDFVNVVVIVCKSESV